MSGAILSPCGTWRYLLWRDVCGTGPVVALFGVNPSTADADKNDATIRKEIGFAQRHGWRKILKVNPFAFRATDVTLVAKAPNPIGPDNLLHLARAIEEADILIPCWGDTGKVPDRLRGDFGMLLANIHRSGKPVLTFGLTKNGSPKHPLMLAYDTPLIPLLP